MACYPLLALRWRDALHRLLVLCVGLCLCAGTQAFTLRVALEDANNAPYSYLTEQGDWAGFHIEIARAVAQQLQWDIQFMAYPWPRAQNLLVQGAADAILYLGQTRKRQSFAFYLPDNRLHVQRVSFYIRRQDQGHIRFAPPLPALLDTWRFGAARDYYIGEEFVAAVAAGHRLDQTARTPEHLFRMLLGNRIDVAVAETEVFRLFSAKFAEHQSKIIAMPNAPVQELPMFIAFKRQDDGPRLAERFAAAYAAWRQTEAYSLLIQRHGVAASIPEDFRPTHGKRLRD